MTPVDPMPVQRLLDEAVKLARAHFARIVPAAAVPMALGSGLASAVQIAVQSDQVRSFGLDGRTLLFVASLLLSVVTFALGSGAVTAAAVDAAAGRAIDMRRAWLTFLRPRVMFTSLLAFAGTMLGMFCCLVPGVYLALIWSVAIPVMLEEGRFGGSALARSADLMSYNPSGGLQNDPRFRAFVVLFAGVLIGYALAMLVQLPLGILMAVSVAREMAKGGRGDAQELMGPLAWLQVPTNMLGMALNACTQLFSMSGVSILYFDARRRREGFDLEQAAERLAGRDAGQ